MFEIFNCLSFFLYFCNVNKILIKTSKLLKYYLLFFATLQKFPDIHDYRLKYPLSSSFKTLRFNNYLLYICKICVASCGQCPRKKYITANQSLANGHIFINIRICIATRWVILGTYIHVHMYIEYQPFYYYDIFPLSHRYEFNEHY